MKKTVILLALLLGMLRMSTPSVLAQLVDIDSGSYTLKNSNDSTVLLTGDVIQFGYYTNATASNPFAGTFVALTSAGGSTPVTVIGQETAFGAGNGTFAYQGLNLNIPTNELPANGQIMSFVIFNNSTVASSSDYAAFADLGVTWNYSASAQFPVPQGFSLDDTGTWEGNDVGFTGIPEPSTYGLLGAGLSVLAILWRKRQTRAAAPRRLQAVLG